ncbi:hypothetical protein Tco_0553303 [Tanacetum coccineum]
MNEDYYEQNSCYVPNSFGFDQFQPQQYTVNHPILNAQNEFLNSQNKLMEQMTSICDMVGQIMQKKEEERQIALMDKQYRQEDIQELMSKLLEDVRNISEEFSEYINCPSWNRLLFYFDDDDDEYTVIWRRPKAIIPDELSEEPEDPLIMREREFSTIPKKDKSSVEDLVPIPSGSKGVSDDIFDNDHSDAESLLSQDIPITSPKINFLSEEFAGEFAPIPLRMDEDEFDEEEFNCYDHDISSNDDSYENIEYIEPDQGGLTSVVISDNSNDPLLELPEFESFHFDLDPSFPRPPPEPPDIENSLIVEIDAPVINNVDELNEDECFDPGGGEINVEVDNSFTIITWTFLPFLTYPEVSPLLSSTKNEDTIFDPGIST